MITPSQIVLASLIIFIILRTVVAYKRRHLSESFVVVWLVFWLGTLFLVFQQQLVSDFAHRLGISRGVDLVIYVSLIIIFYSLYRIMVWTNDMDRKFTELVRKIALESKDKKRHSRKV